MINYFTIPDSRANFEMNVKLLDAWNLYPEFFKDDFKIETAFGCPNPSIWNGNRPNNYGNAYSFKDVQIMFSTYLSFGVNYRLTFTNPLIEEDHLNDYFSNIVAKEGNIKGNGVIVMSDILKKYIKDNYCNYTIINSIVNFFKDKSKINIDTINEWSKDEIVVLPVTFNNDFDTLSKLKHPENIEVLCNQPCIDNCPFSYQHYDAYNRYNLYYPVDTKDLECRVSYKGESYKKYKDVPRMYNTKMFVKPEYIIRYNDLGINHFKIAGRDIPDLALESYISYFVKDRYKALINKYLLNIISDFDITWDELVD